MQVATKIQLRRDTAANWTATNPILAQGEQGHETDTNRRKIGDGVNDWNTLPYLFEAPPIVFPIPYEIFQTGTTVLAESPAAPVVVDLNTEVDAVAGYSISGGGAEVTDAGSYRYNYIVSGDSQDGDRSVIRASIFVNGVEVARTQSFGYCRNVATGEGSATRSGKLILGANDVVTVRASIFGDNVTTITLGSSLVLEKRV